MLYERMKSYFRVSGSSKIKTFTKCILSALLAAEVAAYITYSCVKSEEKTEDIAETEGSYISQEKMQEIYDPCVRVNLHYTLKKDIDGTEEQIHPFGSGVLLEDRLTWELYVLTANHVTPSDTYENKSGEKFKVVESNMEVESLEAKVIKKDEKADLALLKIEVPAEYDTNNFRPYLGKIAGELNENDYLVGAGYPAGKKNYFITRAKAITENSTFIEMIMVGGNSGGGTYRLKDKQLELAGVVLQTSEISSLAQLRELIEGTPLEDDYLQ